jgi:hypothetical protein
MNLELCANSVIATLLARLVFGSKVRRTCMSSLPNIVSLLRVPTNLSLVSQLRT